MPACVVLEFARLEVVQLDLGVQHRHVGVRHAVAVPREEDISNPQVDAVDPPARYGDFRHLGIVVSSSTIAARYPRPSARPCWDPHRDAPGVDFTRMSGLSGY